MGPTLKKRFVLSWLSKDGTLSIYTYARRFMIINNKTNVIEVQSQWNQAEFEPRILQSAATRSAI